MIDIPASITIDLRVDAAGARAEEEHRGGGDFLGLHRLLARDGLLGIEIGIHVPGIPAEAEVFKSPGATALKRIREKRLNDLARNASEESSAAFTGAMKP